MADQEFLASFGVDIDESGVSRLQKILTENRTLGDSLAASFNAAAEGVKAFKESISTDLPSLFGGYGNVTENLFGSAGGLKIGLNMTEPKKEIASFTADAKKPIKLSANASGIVSAARTALENVRSLFSETFTINVRASTNMDNGEEKKEPRNDSRNRDDTGSGFLRMSTGGRFTRPTNVQVAEDGDAEYIIPVKKEGQALPLLRQLLSELSPEARQSLTPAAQEPETEDQAVPVPAIRETFAEADRPLASASVGEKNEVPETVASVPIPSSSPEGSPGDQETSLSGLLKELTETGKELLTTPQTNSAPVSVEKETVPKLSAPALIPVEKEPAPQLSASAPMFAAKEDISSLSMTAPLPTVRETLSEADQPLAPAPAVQTESLSSGSVAQQESVSDLISRLSSALQPAGNTVTNTSNNVSAPVTINVNARGSDAEKIGETIYNTAERYLLRTLKSPA